MSTPDPAPIVVFAYKRRDHLSRMLESLAANELAAQSRLYVYCDAARGPADDAAVAAVRERVASLSGFASVEVVHRATNHGLARSIVTGTSDVLERHGRAIVVEDDLVLSPYFLRYMNEALDLYAEDDGVASIHGYVLPVAEPVPETFFLRGADCWGWGTWSRAWRHFEPDGAALLAALRRRGLTRQFDLDGTYPYTRMLEDQVAGRNDSWAVRWHAACFLKSLQTLYPARSLVDNIGNDSSGTHCGTTGVFSAAPSGTPIRVDRIAIAESAAAREAMKRFHRRTAGPLARVRQAALRAAGMTR